MIVFNNITCGYGNTAVLSGIVAQIRAREVTCLLGKNGVGKTTLFKTVLGLLPLIGGSIQYSGKNRGELSARQFARYISYVPQAHSNPFPFSVAEVVLMGQFAHSEGRLGLANPGTKQQDIAERCLVQLGIEYLKHRIFSSLSGGEKQMVLIARAMAQQTEFIAMDEPTSNLDLCNQMRVMQVVAKLKQCGYGVIINTHSPQHALQYADQVLLLKEGALHKAGSPETVITGASLSDLYGVPIEIVEACTAEGHTRKILVEG